MDGLMPLWLDYTHSTRHSVSSSTVSCSGAKMVATCPTQSHISRYLCSEIVRLTGPHFNVSKLTTILEINRTIYQVIIINSRP
ncbi:unnamed protein product [Protopolystoma xenopodis]|uniref:Uncharacterized protein n=1 Tax=Protopolystoma xenopodis TaxID=117903 RepID=A0A448X521_9PLAT|nr:unnamed protein product [Protopolystoma xenopodis]